MTDVIQSSGGGGDNNTAGNDSNDDVDVVVMTTNDNDNVNNNNDDNNDSDDDDDDIRIGSISSARFNILSTMVGGGCLSLPMAFQQSGNALCGPIMLLITGFITDFCFRSLVATAIHIQKPHSTRSGKDTFESITQTAFGQSGYIFSMGLVVLMCFFGTVGYSVLLRDMMVPLNDVIAPHLFHGHGILSNWFHRNFTMFLVILIVTPFCTLRRLTALKNCGALSMGSLLILGSCIVFRSVQCNLNCSKGDDTEENEPWYTYLKLFPDSWHDLLNAVPLYISCFVCHYNILPVHNELMDPSPARVSWWLRSTTWFAVLLYMIMGFAGSSYAHCTPTGKVQGNILLDFDENDPLLMVGRMCLAITITLAFPMLVIPGRDIMLRSLILPRLARLRLARQQQSQSRGEGPAVVNVNRTIDEELQEPLLSPDQQQQHQSMEISGNDDDNDDNDDDGTDQENVLTANENLATSNEDGGDDNGSSNSSSGGNGNGGDDLRSAPTIVLLCTSVLIFWSAGTVASVVKSIDVVWDLLGSSLSILLSYLIPAGTYLVITNKQRSSSSSSIDTSISTRDWLSRAVCWLLLWFFIPLMIVSTGNAIVNTFS